MLISFPYSSVGKESSCNVGDLGSIPGLGRSPGEGKGYLLQYSGLENSMDYIVHGVTKSWTRLSSFHFHLLVKSFLNKPLLVSCIPDTSRVYIFFQASEDKRNEEWERWDQVSCFSWVWVTADLHGMAGPEWVSHLKLPNPGILTPQPLNFLHIT